MINLDTLRALDVETEPTVKTDKPYALEPWRRLKGEAKVSCMTIVNDDSRYTTTNDQDIAYRIELLEGQYVVCHNAIFDVAWMLSYTTYDRIRKVKWVDSMLLAKWLLNSKEYENFSFSLINLCNHFLPQHPDLFEFNSVKGQNVTAGEDKAYWLRRNVLDTRMTLALFREMWRRLPKAQRRGFLIEQRTIAPIAKGWLNGIPFDLAHVNKLNTIMEKKKKQLCAELGVSVTCLSSPKQKKELIFGTWGYKPKTLTPTGAPSTAVDVLMRLHQESDDPRFDKLMAGIKLATLQSKYIKGFQKAKEYNGYEKIHGAPRLFGTYTGRMTYASKTIKKHQVSIALHQIPRKAKSIKHAMKAPEGQGVLYMDANSQELRWMAEKSMDRVLIHNYQQGLDLHSQMTASIYGRPYHEVVDGNFEEIKEIVEERQSGKLVNLSCQYRIGAKALAGKFFSTYSKNITVPTAARYLSMYKKQYPGVMKYWDSSIALAKARGYATTIGDRRYYIKKFDWQGESSAINEPIQGSGADHTLATIALIDAKMPYLTLAVQVHDALIWFCPLDKLEESAKKVIELTNSDIYSKMFDKELPINFPFDAAIGDSFGNLKGVQ